MNLVSGPCGPASTRSITRSTLANAGIPLTQSLGSIPVGFRRNPDQPACTPLRVVFPLNALRCHSTSCGRGTFGSSAQVTAARREPGVRRFCQHLPQGRYFQRFRQQPLQLGVLFFQAFQLARVRNFHAAVFRPPRIKRRVVDAVPAA